jgi:hypothetical protein
MSNNNRPNPFKQLNLGSAEDETPAAEYQYRAEVICSTVSSEAITALVAETAPGEWSYGYDILFANGRKAFRYPSREYGVFITEQDAILYFCGCILSCRDNFTAEAIDMVKERTLELMQHTLF